MKNGITLLAIFLLSLVTPICASEQSDQQKFTLSGNVYTSNGEAANSTSIKVDSMQSSWSSDGQYSFEGISPGVHTARAYFMNDGHTVVYRKILIESDTILDWYEGKNWITYEIIENQSGISDSPLNTVTLIQTSETVTADSGRGDFGPYSVGEYYTIRSYYGGIDHSTQYIHFKMEPGSSSNPAPNDFEFNHGHNSRYGFLTDGDGSPIEGATVSTETDSSITNSDGFFLIQNMEVGSLQNFSVSHWGNELVEPFASEISDGQGWMNLTTSIEKNMPDFANFTTQIITSPMEPIIIEWTGGEYTDHFSLYLGGELAYRGGEKTFKFEPEQPGNYLFSIESINSNGSKTNPEDLKVIVLPDQSNSDLWSPGMSWNYSITHTPEFYQNKTYTAIGSESITDAFDNQVDSFLLRVSDEEYEEGEKAFLWVDSETLMTVHTFWADAPSSSSYYQEGFLGWKFSNSGGNSVNPINYQGGEDLSLHFNRTNIIGVPGHPNGYDDTTNSVKVTHGVEIETAAGKFTTTHLEITDDKDGIVSWEMWYNETVRNWVKVIDQLPGSHSDKVVRELTSFEVPTTPQFITEELKLFSDDDFKIEWAQFPGAQSYQIVENGGVIYTGEDTHLNLSNRPDGKYNFQVNALMQSGKVVEGDSIQIEVRFVLQPPVFISESHSTSEGKTSIFWNTVEGDVKYTVLVIYEDGSSLEAYHGHENQTVLEDLEIGINRIRVKATLANGISSDFSESIFVTSIESEDGDDTLPFQSAILTLAILALASANSSRGKRN